MDKDNILLLQHFFGGEKGKEIKQKRNEIIKNNPINIHSDCILQISNLKDKNIKLAKEINDLKLQLNEVSKWKENHNCNNNINIEEIKTNIKKEMDINDFPEYVEIRELNKTYNKKIIKLESDMKDIQLNSNIEDNVLFKQLKKQNSLLFEANKTLQFNYNELKVENNNIKQKINNIENNNNIPDINKDSSIDINLKFNEAFEKQKETLSQEYENKYSSNILSLTETIKKLQEQLDELKNNKKDKKLNKNNDKYFDEYVYNSIYIYNDISLPYQVYRASKTYNKLLDEMKFNNVVNNVDYKDVTNWINENEKTNFKSNYFKNKYERSKIILDKYKDEEYKLKILKFSISYISNMSEKKFKEWLQILDNKLNSFYNSNENYE